MGQDVDVASLSARSSRFNDLQLWQVTTPKQLLIVPYARCLQPTALPRYKCVSIRYIDMDIDTYSRLR